MLHPCLADLRLVRSQCFQFDAEYVADVRKHAWIESQRTRGFIKQDVLTAARGRQGGSSNSAVILVRIIWGVDEDALRSREGDGVLNIFAYVVAAYLGILLPAPSNRNAEEIRSTFGFGPTLRAAMRRDQHGHPCPTTNLLGKKPTASVLNVVRVSSDR